MTSPAWLTEDSAGVQGGGLHLWLALPAGLDDVDLTDRARSRQLLIAAGRPYYVVEPPGPRLWLSFGVADPAQSSAGVQLLAETLEEAVREQER